MRESKIDNPIQRPQQSKIEGTKGAAFFACFGVYTRVLSNSVLVFYGCIPAILRPCAYDAGTTRAGMRDRDRTRVRRGVCLGEVSLQSSSLRNRDHNRDRVCGLYFGRAAEPSMRKLLRAVPCCRHLRRDRRLGVDEVKRHHGPYPVLPSPARNSPVPVTAPIVWQACLTRATIDPC